MRIFRVFLRQFPFWHVATLIALYLATAMMSGCTIEYVPRDTEITDVTDSGDDAWEEPEQEDRGRDDRHDDRRRDRDDDIGRPPATDPSGKWEDIVIVPRDRHQAAEAEAKRLQAQNQKLAQQLEAAQRTAEQLNAARRVATSGLLLDASGKPWTGALVWVREHCTECRWIERDLAARPIWKTGTTWDCHFKLVDAERARPDLIVPVVEYYVDGRCVGRIERYDGSPAQLDMILAKNPHCGTLNGPRY